VFVLIFKYLLLSLTKDGSIDQPEANRPDTVARGFKPNVTWVTVT